MFIRINTNNELAIYDQVVRQIKFAVANQSLRPGELIPSVRELSKQLAINPNTVARAYRQLQDEGVLDSVRGTGLKVTVGAVSQCRTDRRNLIRERLSQAIAEAVQSGLTVQDIEQLVKREMKSACTL